MTEQNNPPAANQTVPPQAASPNRYFAPPPPPVVLPNPAAGGNFKRGFGVGFGASVGFGTVMIVGSVISSLLFMLMMVGMVAAAKGTNTASSQPLNRVWGAESAKHVIRAIDIRGPIMADPSDGSLLQLATYGYEVAMMIDNISDKDYDGLALFINTPGGSINGSYAIADAIKRYKERTGKKVVAYVRGMSASGGMMVMAGADEIIADRGSLIGSVGVILGPLAKYQGVKTVGSPAGTVSADKIEQFYVTEGKGKDLGNPFRDLAPEERAALQNLLSGEYTNFVEHVAKNRNIPADKVRNEYGAYLFDVQNAIKNRYADAEVSGPDEGFRRLAKTIGVDPEQTKIVKASAPGLVGLLLGADDRVFGQAPVAKSVAGEPARAASALCSGSPKVLAYWGDPATICG